MPRRERTITDIAIQWPMLLAALRILRRHLGMRGIFPVMGRVLAERLRGEPWKGLPPYADEKERLSREEIAGAILLYRALLRRLEPEAARAILAEIVIEGALASFAYLLDPLTPDALRALPEQDRRDFVLQNLARFPNADVRLEEAGPERLSFTVVHCRFPALLAAVGHPELAPLFCAGDQRYFEERLGLAFHRPHIIAEGADTCPFLLSIRPADRDNQQ